MSAVMGRSVLDEIIRCRFSRAERLLRETQLPIKTVVALAGFGSAENLRHVFLSRTKLSPSEYRQQAKGAGLESHKRASRLGMREKSVVQASREA